MDRASLVEYVQIRRRSGEALKDIARDFGVSHITVWRWCSGDRGPTASLRRLADFLVRDQLARGLWRDHPELEKAVMAENGHSVGPKRL